MFLGMSWGRRIVSEGASGAGVEHGGQGGPVAGRAVELAARVLLLVAGAAADHGDGQHEAQQDEQQHHRHDDGDEHDGGVVQATAVTDVDLAVCPAEGGWASAGVCGGGDRLAGAAVLTRRVVARRGHYGEKGNETLSVGARLVLRRKLSGLNTTVLTFNSCTKCVGSPDIIHDRTPDCYPVS